MDVNTMSSIKPEYPVTAEQASQLLSLQRDILEKVAMGVDYKIILDDLCRAAEVIVSNALASIMVYDETGTFLTVLAAPSIPAEAVAALNGLVPGQCAGSCGTAVYSNKAQYVVDTKIDQRWCNLQDFVHAFSIGACWSAPVKIGEGKVIGSFALSSFETRTPSVFYKQLLETSAHIVGIILKGQENKQKLWKLAHYDVLTGLVNRNFLKETLSTKLEEAAIEGCQLAILSFDIDGFKDINDSQGHDVGDQVLQKVTINIKGLLSDKEVFACLGGDKFVILMIYSEGLATVEELIEKIALLFKQKIIVQQIEFNLSVGLGVSCFPVDGSTAQELLRHADTAMHEAKKKKRGGVRFYNQALTKSLEDKLEIIYEMRSALADNEFVLHYQPQYCQKTNQLVGVEALVRWQHPKKGMIPPDKFIAIAEETGVIQELGLWVLTEACRQCKEWWAEGVPDFSVAVNLSVKQLDEENIRQFQDILLAMDFPIRLLELEITESLIMEADSLKALDKLAALGIQIAMDDFGTGHSSLAQLKHLPISKLKIDRSFVQDLDVDENDKVIAKTIINMGHSLGLKVLAEGVETQSQLDFLAKEGCDLIQGYLLSRPLSVEQLEKIFEQDFHSAGKMEMRP